MRLARIGRGLFAGVLDKGVILLIQLATVSILSRYWGLDRFGTWAMLTSIPAILALADLGVGVAAQGRMAAELARGDAAAARVTSHSAWAIVLASTLAILLMALAGMVWVADRANSPIPHMRPADLQWTIAALAGYSVTVLAGTQLQAVFRAQLRFATGTLLMLATIVTESVLLFTVAWLGGSIRDAALLWFAGRLGGTMVQAAVIARLFPAMRPGIAGASRAVVRALLPLALAALALTMATALLVQGTVLALGAVAGAMVVPAFVAARTLSRTGLQFSQMLAMPLMAELATSNALDDRASNARIVFAVVVTALGISLPLALLIGIAGPTIIDLWTDGAIVASPTLMGAFAVSALAGGVWFPAAHMLMAVNRQREFTPVYVVLAALGCGFTYAAGHALGPLAGGLSLAAVDCVMLAVVGWKVWSRWLRGENLCDLARFGLVRMVRALPLRR